jgi:NDP-sugar pyrophosphorylase family protein
VTDPGVEPMQCVVLAGGLGTRMRAITGELPKALVPVAGRPFVDHQLAWLAREGVRDVVLCVGYGGKLLRDFVGDGSRWGVAVAYVDEGDDLRGTGGALRLALDEGALAEAFSVLYGDSYLPISLAPVWAAFRAGGAPALMTVLRNDGRWDESNARYEDGRVTLYAKGRARDVAGLDWIDYGFSVLTAPIVAERIPRGRPADLADLYGQLSREGLLAGCEVGERFYEVGSPQGLRDLEGHLTGSSPDG